MIAVVTLTVFILAMAIAPSKEDLAREIADANGECGFIRDGHICTLPKGHPNGHRGIRIETSVPITKR